MTYKFKNGILIVTSILIFIFFDLAKDNRSLLVINSIRLIVWDKRSC